MITITISDGYGGSICLTVRQWRTLQHLFRGMFPQPERNVDIKLLPDKEVMEPGGPAQPLKP